jgi:hypothetical protein
VCVCLCLRVCFFSSFFLSGFPFLVVFYYYYYYFYYSLIQSVRFIAYYTALGGATGGYTTASKEVISLLRQRSRPYLFSNTIAPVVVGASIKCFDWLMDDNSLIQRLERNTKQFREGMTNAGFDLGGSGTLCTFGLRFFY